MNFLAHIYLSGKSKEIRLGNFIGDFVKGKQYLNFHEKLQKGILLHRYIDSFTDRHAIVKTCSRRWKPYYKRYSGIVVDFFFDHFLAKNWLKYSGENLDDFSNNFYDYLNDSLELLPIKVRIIAHYMTINKRLQSYATIEGIGKAMSITSQYTSLPDKTDHALEILRKDYNDIEDEFSRFFNEICLFVQNEHGIVFDEIF